MAFERLLGNQQLKQNLLAGIRRGHVSHFYLISGPAGSGKHTLASMLAAALMCEDADRPCGHCSACRKISANAHPDYITVDDPEHKNVAVKIIREARESMFVRPNEGIRKIYLFPQEMGVEGQNALLKILEEPPSYGVFILLSDNPEKLLTTVRSRCTELRMTPVEESVLRPYLQEKFPDAPARNITEAIRRSGGYPGQAIHLLSEEETYAQQVQDFAQAFSRRDALGLLQLLVPMEKWKRDQILPVFSAWKEVLQGGLHYRSGIPAASELSELLGKTRSAKELLAAVNCLQKAIDYTQGNVSVAAVCGWLVWVLR